MVHHNINTYLKNLQNVYIMLDYNINKKIINQWNNYVNY